MSTDVQADPAKSAGSAGPLSRRRHLGDRGFQLLALLAGLLVLAILIGIAASTAQQGSDWFSTAGFKGIFSTVWDVGNSQFGMMSFVFGTALTSVIAIVIGVPVSLAVALLKTPGRGSEAVAQLREVIRRDPGNAQAAQILSRVRPPRIGEP